MQHEPYNAYTERPNIYGFIGTSELTLQCRRLSSRSDQNNHREILRINQVRQGKLYNTKVCKPWKLCSWNRNDRHRTIFPCLVSKCLSLNNLWNLRIILKQQEGAMFKSVSGSPNLRVLNNAEQFDHSTMSKAAKFHPPALEPSSLCPGPTNRSSWKLRFRNSGNQFMFWRPGVSPIKRKYDRT